MASAPFVHVIQQFRRIGERTLLGPLDGVVDFAANLRAKLLDIVLLGPVVLNHSFFQTRNGVLTLPFLEQMTRHVVCGVMGRVAGHAESFAFDEIGTLSGARVFHRPERGLMHSEDVITIHDFGGDAISWRAVRDIGAAHLLTERRRIRVLIVVAYVDHRQLLYGGQVHPFMPVTPAGGAVAEKAIRHVMSAFVLQSQRRARSHRHRGSHGADDGNDPAVHIAHVHVAVFAPCEAAHTAHVLGENLPRMDAANQKDSQVAMRGAKNIDRVRREPHADWNGFLAPPYIHAADDLALAVELAFDAVFDLAHHRHIAQKLKGQFAFLLGLSMIADCGWSAQADLPAKASSIQSREAVGQRVGADVWVAPAGGRWTRRPGKAGPERINLVTTVVPGDFLTM